MHYILSRIERFFSAYNPVAAVVVDIQTREILGVVAVVNKDRSDMVLKKTKMRMRQKEYEERSYVSEQMTNR